MSRSNRQALNIVWLAIVLAVGFALLGRITSWRAELAETNFQSNNIRLQNYLFDPPSQAVIVGSSLSGRVLASYFDGTSLAPMANLGLDGSSPVFGLDVVLIRPSPVVIIEENLLLNPLSSNEDEMLNAMQSLHFQSAKYLPMLRANSRPSSMLYTWAKSHNKQTAEFSPRSVPKAAATNVQAKTSLALTNLTESSGIREKLRSQIKDLSARGCRILLVRLPTSRPFDTHNQGFALGDELKREFNLTEIDLAQECASRNFEMKYTDGYHLSPPSARRIAQVLAELSGGKQTGNPAPSP